MINNHNHKRVAVLGSTGSIGRSTLDVIRHLGNRFQVAALSANSKLDELFGQATEFSPRWLVATDEAQANEFEWPDLDRTEIKVGHEALNEVVSDPEIDIVVAAIVGIAGLESTWHALEHGKTVALANKETLVVAGPSMLDLAERNSARILPVDSEHSAVFQCIAAGDEKQVQRVILTASGGPFREFSAEQLRQVTPEQALVHPTWQMGAKITIDSATMMNKALEIIEARWLFGLSPRQIEVVIHPQSIVHSMVEFADNSVVAQMSPPDMKLPIQYALTYPDRLAGPAERLDLSTSWCLDFEPPDLDRFPAIGLGLQVAESGGTAGAALNAANEVAVEAFLNGRLGFTEIVEACRTIVDSHDFDPRPSFEQLIETDRWARKEINKWICA